MGKTRISGARWAKMSLAATLFGIVLGTSAASAQTEPSGITLGTGLVYGLDRYDTDGVENSFGWDLRGGYRWGYIAGELGMQYLPNFKTSSSDTEGKVRNLLLGANAKVYPFPKRSLEPYALVGVGMTRIEDRRSRIVDGEEFDISSDYTNLMFRFGGGLEMSISESISVFFEGSYVLDIDRNADIVPVGGGVRMMF